MELLKTGISKSGYLLKRERSSLKNNKWCWRSYFVLLNGNCLSYCSPEGVPFEHSEENLLLTSTTKVYEHDDEEELRIETGFEVVLLKGYDKDVMKEWKRQVYIMFISFATKFSSPLHLT